MISLQVKRSVFIFIVTLMSLELILKSTVNLNSVECSRSRRLMRKLKKMIPMVVMMPKKKKLLVVPLPLPIPVPVKTPVPEPVYCPMIDCGYHAPPLPVHYGPAYHEPATHYASGGGAGGGFMARPSYSSPPRYHHPGGGNNFNPDHYSYSSYNTHDNYYSPGVSGVSDPYNSHSLGFVNRGKGYSSSKY